MELGLNKKISKFAFLNDVTDHDKSDDGSISEQINLKISSKKSLENITDDQNITTKEQVKNIKIELAKVAQNFQKFFQNQNNIQEKLQKLEEEKLK
jgi:hypothetical protein